MLLQDIQDSLAFMKDEVATMDALIDDKRKEVPELELKARCCCDACDALAPHLASHLRVI